MNYVFNEEIFNIFTVAGLENRMDLIRSDIQPLFRYYGGYISDYVSDQLALEQPLPVHVARHIQRSVHPPESTWVAVAGDKRGYKKYPHFQVGINGDYLFITIAFIDNIKYQFEIAKEFQKNLSKIQALSSDFVIIPDHTKLDYHSISDVDLEKYLTRLSSVKSAELMIGRVETKAKPQFYDANAYKEWIQSTIDELLPLYELAMQFYINE